MGYKDLDGCNLDGCIVFFFKGGESYLPSPPLFFCADRFNKICITFLLSWNAIDLKSEESSLKGLNGVFVQMLWKK